MTSESIYTVFASCLHIKATQSYEWKLGFDKKGWYWV
jgi:hypothetical protein